MLKFIFSSLSFKPNFDQTKQFFFVVSTFDGTVISTEPVTYDPDSNVAVFSEILEIKPFLSNKNNLIILELYLQDEKSQINQSKSLSPSFKKPHKPFSIAKRVLETNLQALKELNSKPLILKTNLKNKGNILLDVILKVSISINRSSADSVETPKDKNIEIGLLKPFIDEMFEFSQHQKGELEIVNANSINHNYLKKITPIVLITNYLSDVFQWKSPAHTLIFGLVLTLCALYLQIIIAFGFFLFYINTPFFLRQLLKIPYGKQKIKKELNIFERNKNKLIKLKRNMTHIQEAQKDYIKKYDYLKALITNEDRTDLIQITLNSRKYILFVILFIIFFDTLTCFLICFWVLLLKNSVYGKPILTELQNGLETFNRIINENIDYIARKFRIFPVPPAIHSVVKKHSDNLSSQKTFIIYENQRWWIGKGWSDLLLPGERPKYSDIDGKLSLEFKNVNLPDPESDWVWETDWLIEKNHHTDEDGWEYSYDFNNVFHPHNNKIDLARRRKWYRKCSKS